MRVRVRSHVEGASAVAGRGEGEGDRGIVCEDRGMGLRGCG